MRTPKYIRDLAGLGHTLADVTAFQESLREHKITVYWNSHRAIWWFQMIGGRGHGEAISIQCRMGMEAFVAALESPVENLVKEFAARDPAAKGYC